MEARHEIPGRLCHVRATELQPLVPARKAVVAITCGLAGGLALALPIELYDGASAAHSALELPMAATAWLFGLEHVAQNGYDWWPIVFGALILAGYWVLHGVFFGGVVDNFLQLSTLPETLGAGFAWGFVS